MQYRPRLPPVFDLGNAVATSGRARAELAYAVLAAACAGLAVWVYVFHYAPGGDYWEHAAAMRAWSADLLHPANPQLVTPEPSPRFTPLVFPVAAAAAAFNWPVDVAIAVLALFNTMLLLTGVYVFARVFFRQPWAPVLLLGVMVGAWGFDPWLWSSVYALPSLVRVLPFSSSGALAASLLTLAALVSVLRAQAPSRMMLGAVTVGAAVVVSAHLLTAAFFLGTAMLLTVLSRGASRRARALAAGAVVIGAALAFLWPYYDLWGVLTERHRETIWFMDPQLRPAMPRHRFYQFENLVDSLGVAALGAGSAIWFAVRRRFALYLAGVALFAAPYVVNLVVFVPLGHRFVIYAVVFMHLALTHHMLLLMGHWRRTDLRTRAPAKLTVAVAASAVLIAAHSGFMKAGDLLEGLSGPAVWDHRSGFETSDIARIAALLPGDAVVAGEERTTWRLGAHGAPVLSLLNPNPLVEGLDLRSMANTLLLFPEADSAMRASIIARYGVTHVLLDEALLSGFGDLPAFEAWLGPPVAVEGRLHLYAAPSSVAAEPLTPEAFDLAVRCALLETINARRQARGQARPDPPAGLETC